jgi:kynurenine formamidase
MHDSTNFQYGQRQAVDDVVGTRGSLADAYAILKSKRFVDLTHPFAPGIPHWQGFPDERRDTLFTHAGAGFRTQRYSFVGQWGTHVDAPAHFVPGLRTVDQIDVREMILPLVVLDVHTQVAANPDYTVTLEDVRDWEAQNGLIPAGAFVALRTDWSRRWPDMDAFYNPDEGGIAHTPGWSFEVLVYLYEECGITASGHETIDTDPGHFTSQNSYPLERYILSRNSYQIELLTNLADVPEAGALVVVSFPKPKDGDGFPARVFAIVP